MKAPDLFESLEPVIRAFESLGIGYMIGGSVASSAYGMARATLDVDVVADLEQSHIQPLIERLQGAFYIDEERVRDAVTRRISFNLIHLESILKIDVFVLKSRPYDREAFSRARLETLCEDELPRQYYVSSPEDIILSKLDWYRQGGCVSERQWNDVLGILKVQQSSLDMSYVRHWAEVLELADSLSRALGDAGMTRGAE